MKKIFTVLTVIAAMLFGAETARAQVGLEVGYVNSVQRLKAEGDQKYKMPQSGFYLEVDYGVRLFRGLKVAPGIQYAYLAGESRFPLQPSAPFVKSSVGDATVDDPVGPAPDKHPETVEHYLSIPVDISYTFGFGRAFGLTAFITPTMSCGLKSEMKVRNTSTDMYKTMSEMLGKDGAYSRVDFQLGIGLSADILNHFRIKCSYDFGLADRATVSDFSLHHNMFKVGIGVIF